LSKDEIPSLPSRDLIIKNGKIATNGNLVESDIFISAGRISAVERQTSTQAAHVLNANGLLIFPFEDGRDLRSLDWRICDTQFSELAIWLKSF